MTYLAVASALFGLLLAWSVLKAVLRQRRFANRQNRLASAFYRSQGTRTHGPGAQGITQNILIANMPTSSRRVRRNSV